MGHGYDADDNIYKVKFSVVDQVLNKNRWVS